MKEKNKSYLKYLVNLFFTLLLYVLYKLYAIEGVTTLLRFIPPSLIVPTLRKYGAKIGENVIIHSPLAIHNARENYANLEIEDDVYLGREVFLDITDKIKIGRRAVISMRVTLLTHFDVGLSQISKIMPATKASLIIEDDAYIGAGSTIKSGVTIGKGSLVAAMSFVNKDVNEDTLVGGVPAKAIRKLERQQDG